MSASALAPGLACLQGLNVAVWPPCTPAAAIVLAHLVQSLMGYNVCVQRVELPCTTDIPHRKPWCAANRQRLHSCLLHEGNDALILPSGAENERALIDDCITELVKAASDRGRTVRLFQVEGWIVLQVAFQRLFHRSHQTTAPSPCVEH